MGKVSDRTALAGADTAVGDLVPVVDVSATTSGSKKMTLPELFAAIPVVLTTEMTGTGAASTDELLFSDAGVMKTITVLELAAAQIQVSSALTGSGVVPGTDTVCVSDAGVSKKMTFTEFMTALALAGYTLADIPEYADQAAAATGLSGTGKLWRQTTTGLLGITIT